MAQIYIHERSNESDVKLISVGDYIYDGKGNRGKVVDIIKISLAWGIKFIFKLDTNQSITKII